MYLVTGGAGFIGSHIARALIDGGAAVRVLDNLSTGRLENLGCCLNRLEFIEGDIGNADLGPVFNGVEAVLHQAAISSVERAIRDPLETEINNVAGTVSILQQAKEAGVKRVIIASSAAVYGNPGRLPLVENSPAEPLSPYAISKFSCEYYARCYARLYGLETVVLRYFNVFGPNQDPGSDYSGVITRFISRMVQGEPPVIFGDGNQTRDFVYVDNVVQANLLALKSGRVGRGEVINIGSGGSVTVNRLAEEINAILGTTLPAVYAEPRAGEVRHSRADITRAKELLGYRVTVDFKTGLARVIDWYRQGV